MRQFCELIFGSNEISPTKLEYGMYAAKGAALRSMDLSRQVGAAIFTSRGEILSLGSNEVPKAGGGTYWPDDDVDDRDFKRGGDGNEEKKRFVLMEVATALGVEAKIDELLANPKIKNSQLMDVLEYGRTVHAEMSAICDAARLGICIKGAVLCTTFPCHLCAKHIIDAGISEVIFLEPYPKSRAANLHSDSVQVEGSDRGRYNLFPSVKFVHFHGITPRRYRELFERGRRKDAEGKFVAYVNYASAPIVDVKTPFYVEPESVLVNRAARAFLERLSKDHTVLHEEPVAAE
jgi:deoxycytidylate deaminase